MTANILQIALPVDPPWYTVFDAELKDLELISLLILQVYKTKAAKVNLLGKLTPEIKRGS